jgi:hypothetical protein
MDEVEECCAFPRRNFFSLVFSIHWLDLTSFRGGTTSWAWPVVGKYGKWNLVSGK